MKTLQTLMCRFILTCVAIRHRQRKRKSPNDINQSPLATRLPWIRPSGVLICHCLLKISASFGNDMSSAAIRIITKLHLIPSNFAPLGSALSNPICDGQFDRTCARRILILLSAHMSAQRVLFLQSGHITFERISCFLSTLSSHNLPNLNSTLSEECP